MRAWCLAAIVVGCHREAAKPAETLTVDVPTLATTAGTLPLDGDRILEVKGDVPDHVVAPSVVAVDRKRLAVPLIDGLGARGLSPGLLVLAGGQRRMVIVLTPHAEPSTGDAMQVAFVHVGATVLEANGVAVTLDELPRRVGSARLGLAVDPDVTVQRIVDVTAALGGKLAPVPMPRVEPPR